MLRYSLLCVALLGAASHAQAQSADGMFDELSRDFGSVPRGQILLHPFRVVNNTKQPIHIASVRVSCGCVAARALQNYLQPGQETAILAQMDTNRFINTKTVTIFVTVRSAPLRGSSPLGPGQQPGRRDVHSGQHRLRQGQARHVPESKISVTLPRRRPNADPRCQERQQLRATQPARKCAGTPARSPTRSPPSFARDTPAGKWYTRHLAQDQQPGHAAACVSRSPSKSKRP